MLQSKIAKVYQDYKRLEKDWFEKLPTNQLNLLTDRGRVPIDELHLYGEVGFLLLGLKPCVLVEHITRELGTLDSYIQSVCKPWLNIWFSEGHSRRSCLTSDSSSSEGLEVELDLENPLVSQPDFSLSVHIAGGFISHGLQSPEISLQGCWLLYNTSHPLFPIIESNVLDKNCVEILEDTLASLLDYPGSLPMSQNEISSMIRVGYVEVDSGYWLTTYAGQSRQLAAIQKHFHTYRHLFQTHFNYDLELFVEDLA